MARSANRIALAPSRTSKANAFVSVSGAVAVQIEERRYEVIGT
nr:hypothetical protein [Tanacetum cinerariifolium]